MPQCYRFLCQWKYRGQLYPAVFASSKKHGKIESATIVLETLQQIRTNKVRQYLIFKAKGLANILVDQSTINGLDRSCFSEATTTDISILQPKLQNYGNQGRPQHMSLRMPSPFPGALNIPDYKNPDCGKMQAFDTETKRALAGRPPVMEIPTPSAFPLPTSTNSSEKGTPVPRMDCSPVPTSRPITKSEVFSSPDSLTTDMPPAPDSTDYSGMPMLLNDLKLNITGNDLKSEEALNASNSTTANNSISRLHEIGQQVGIRPMFNVLSQSGPPHNPQ